MVRFGKTGLDFGRGTPGWTMIAFLDTALRGVAQVILLDNAYSGLLCLVAIFVNSPLQSAAALAGSSLGTATALLLRADQQGLRSGLYGFNGCLIGLAMPVFLGGNPAMWLFGLLAAALSAAVMVAHRRAAPFLPPLTAPFVIGTWAVIGLAQLLSPAVQKAASTPAATGNGGDLWRVIEGGFSGIAQVYLQPSALSGVIFALALAVASRRVFVLAVLAALASTAVAIAVGLDAGAVRSGLFGYNAVLAAIALGGVFLPPGRPSFMLALVAAAVMPLLQTAFSLALAPIGLPTLSVPFLLVTWAVLLAARALARQA